MTDIDPDAITGDLLCVTAERFVSVGALSRSDVGCLITTIGNLKHHGDESPMHPGRITGYLVEVTHRFNTTLVVETGHYGKETEREWEVTPSSASWVIVHRVRSGAHLSVTLVP